MYRKSVLGIRTSLSWNSAIPQISQGNMGAENKLVWTKCGSSRYRTTVLLNNRGDHWAQLGLADQCENASRLKNGSDWGHQVSVLFVSVFVLFTHELTQ